MTKKNGSEGRLCTGSFQMGEERFPSSPFSPTVLQGKKKKMTFFWKDILAMTMTLARVSAFTKSC